MGEDEARSARSTRDPLWLRVLPGRLRTRLHGMLTSADISSDLSINALRTERTVARLTRDVLAGEEYRLAASVATVEGRVAERIRRALPAIRHETSASRSQYSGSLIFTTYLYGGLLFLVAWLVDWIVVRDEAWADRPAALTAELRAWLADFATTEQWIIGPSVVVLGIEFVRWLVLAPRTMLTNRQAWKREFSGHIEPVARAAVNEVVEEEELDILLTYRAPALTSHTEDSQLVIRDEIRVIHDLCRDRGVGAVAVSGQRGSGKTTLLRAVTGQLEHGSSIAGSKGIGLLVRAPVAYDPREFIIHLFSSLCSKVSGEGPVIGRWIYGAGALVDLLLLPVRLAMLLLMFMLVACGVAAAWSDPPAVLPGWLQLTDSLWVALLGLLSLIAIDNLLALLESRLPVRRPRRDLRALTKEARRHLRHLRFLETSSSSQSLGFGRAGISLGLGRLRQYAEQPATLPDIVDAYRLFLQRVATTIDTSSDGPAVVIGVDELDRIESIQDAARFLNDIKAIFGVPRCSYVVTISEDARARFQRRILDARDVLDSTFDEVIQLKPFDVQEAAALLDHRVVGLSDPFIAFCFCLSGGVPRDLVRTARVVVGTRRAEDRIEVHHRRVRTPRLDQVVQRTIAAELDDLRNGLLLQLGGGSKDPSAAAYLARLSDPGWPGARSSELLEHAAELPPAEPGGGPAHDSLKAALVFYATVLDVFCSTDAGWSDADTLYAISNVRNLLAISPTLAKTQILTLRKDLGLPTPEALTDR